MSTTNSRKKKKVANKESGVEETLDIKTYKIIKVIFATSLQQAVMNEHLAEVVSVTLEEALEKPSNGTIGFQ